MLKLHISLIYGLSEMDVTDFVPFVWALHQDLFMGRDQPREGFHELGYISLEH